jgi:WD40 repeat protein
LGGCAFSPEGVLLATTSNDSTVRLWWIPHGTTYAVLTGHTGWVHTCAFSPDGTIAATTMWLAPRSVDTLGVQLIVGRESLRSAWGFRGRSDAREDVDPDPVMCLRGAAGRECHCFGGDDRAAHQWEL